MAIGFLRRLLSPRPAKSIPPALWQATLAPYRFLTALSQQQQEHLHALCAAFLADKEFHGALGLEVTDAMALAVAAQACLPLLHLDSGLRWYSGFVGIVLHPGEMLAQRALTDESGVVHHWREALTGEAMQGGPLTLSWQDVNNAGESAATGYNVVIHEFIHVMDMLGKGDAPPDGCPMLPAGFLGHSTQRAARSHWKQRMQQSFQQFSDAVLAAERFDGMVVAPWLDAYAAESIDEFFAVTAEAYFVAPDAFAQHFPELLPLYDGFFKP